MPRQFRLPDRIDRSGARKVAMALMGARGDDLELDGAGVRMIGTPGVQVLLAAGRQWALDGRALTFGALSDELAVALERLGLSSDSVASGEVA